MSVEELSYLKESNILDPVHDTLDQEVFNGTTPKQDFFEYHLDHIKEVFRQNGFNPHAFDFYLTGSLCTYQYSSNSDVDISIVCNVDEFSDEDRADLISIVVNSLDGEFFPRTKHQYQHFVQPLGVDIEDLFVLGLRGAWDFQKQEWVLKPSRKRAHDISKEEPDWIVAGIQISDKINSLIDNHNYDEAIELYDQVHKKRQIDQAQRGDYSEGNIIYKFLDNNGTFDRLRNIGKKIARVSFFISHDDDILRSEYFDTFNDPRKTRTHLNANGYPCACGFAKRGKRKVLNEFYEKQRQSIKQSSYKNEDLILYKTSATVDEVINLVVEADLKKDSKWSRRNPEAREDAVEIIKQYTSDYNKKYLRSAVSLFKKGINDRKSLELNAKDKVYGQIPGGGHFYDYNNFKEIFRDLWTNNYGRGFDSWAAYNSFIEDKREQGRKKFDHDEIGFEGVREGAYWNDRDVWVTSFERDFFDSITRVSSLAQDLQNSRLDEYQYQSYVQSLVRAVSGTSIGFLDKLFSNWIVETIKNSQNHIPSEILNIIMTNVLLNAELSKEEKEKLFSENLKAPEKQLQEYVDKKNMKNVLDRFRALLIRLDSVSILIDRYNVRFNLNESSSIQQALDALFEIEEDVREREEYRELLEEWKTSGDWDSPPIFTYEEQKKNPYKATPGIWTVSKIQTENDAVWEGRLMRHCVGDEDQPHIHRLREGIGSFYSVRDPNGIPWATVATDETGQQIGEAYGRHDHDIREHEINILNKFFLKEFGENHEWFSKEDDDKSGEWSELEEPMGTDREPQEIEGYIEDDLGIRYFPDVVRNLDDASKVVDWFSLLNSIGVDSTDSPVWQGYQTDVEDDGDGPYYYAYSGVDVSFGETNIFNLIKEGIEKYNQINQKENSVADEQDDSEYEEELAVKDGTAVGVCLIVLALTDFYGRGPGSNPTLINVLDNYVLKEIFDRSNTPATIAFLKPILFQLRQEIQDVEDFVAEVDEMIENTGTPGSYNFEKTFSVYDEDVQSINEEINPVAPEIGTMRNPYVSDLDADEYMSQTGVRIPIESISDRNIKGLLTSENYQYYLEQLEKTLNAPQELAVNKIEENATNYQLEDYINPFFESVKELLSRESYHTRDKLVKNPELLRQYILNKRNIAYNKEKDLKVKEMSSNPTQMSMSFEMPEEPSQKEVQDHYQQQQQELERPVPTELLLNSETDVNNPQRTDKYERPF